MQESTLIGLENLFLALSDKTRLRLLALMADGDVAVGFLAEKLGESQPKISRHLAYLRSAGLVSTRRDGKWVYYGIEELADPDVSRVLTSTLTSILGDRETQLKPRSHGFEARSMENIEDCYIDDWRPNELEIHLL